MSQVMTDQASSGSGWFSMSRFKGLKEDYENVFVEEWSPYFGAALLVMVVMLLIASGFFWGVFGGLKLWGNYFNNLIGLGPALGIKSELQSPLLHRISLMDINLVIGAFAAALMSRQFKISRPPKLEYIWAAAGGSFMGIGASLAGGCTTGGFFTPVVFSSPTGWVMWAGLLAGAYVGLKLLLWTMENITWGMVAPKRAPDSPVKPYYPLLGIGVIAGIIYWASTWYFSTDKQLLNRALLIPAGFAIGFILHRSRFCFSRVFREPFMTGEGTMTKAMIFALALGVPLGSFLLQKQTVDPFLAIPPTFWIGSLLGGIIFGIGMVFAGGCASGSLWRMGEGHIKLWVAVFFFSWVGSIFGGVVKRWDLLTREMNLDLLLETKVGVQTFLPSMFDGWHWAYLISFAILIIWYSLVRYNESTEKFTVL